MGTKTLIRLLGVLVICGAVFGIVKCADKGKGVTEVASTDEKKAVIENFEVNKVAKIKITEKDRSLTLNKGKKFWEVADRENFKANKKTIDELAIKVWNLKVAQPVLLQENQLGRVKLLDPNAEATKADEAATVVTFSDTAGAEIGSIWLGKTHEGATGQQDPFRGGMATSAIGRYVKSGNKNFVYVVTETFRNVGAKPADWLDDGFFEVSKIQSIARKTQKTEEDWSLSREEMSGDFVLADLKEGEELDATKVTDMKSAFDSPRFDDIYVGEEATEPDFSIFTIKTFDGFTYEIKTGEKNDLNELPLTLKVSGEFPEKREEEEEESEEEKKAADESFAKDLAKKKEKLAKEKLLEGRVFKVRAFVVNSITKTRAELLKEAEKAADKGDDKK